jgi:hypothetical protein
MPHFPEGTMAEFDKTSSEGDKTKEEGAARVADLAPALRDEAGKLADKSMSSGVEAAQAVGKAAESAAQALDETLPLLAGYVRNAAQYTSQFADSLRDKKADELLGNAVTWSRQQPMLTLAGAVVLGFALSRVAKAGLTGAAEGGNASDSSGSGVGKAETGGMGGLP